MKNGLIILVLLVIAFFAYQHFAVKTDQTDASHNMTASAVEEAQTINTNSLISSAPTGAAVFILEPGDGSTVTSPVTIKFGITNMQVVAAGNNTENSGHHHILLDLESLPDMSMPLPKSENIIHFGGGQTDAILELSPGTHTLQLLLGNYLHIPHSAPVISKKITINVE